MEDVHETSEARAGRFLCERIFGCEPEEIGRRTNHDLDLEWQLPSDRGAKSGVADLFADNERPDRADINDAELRQLFGDRGWPAAIRFAHIDRAKENDGRHSEVGAQRSEVRSQSSEVGDQR